MKVPISKLVDTQPRRDHGNIEELKQSILDVGLINPLTINQDYRLIAGRRRYQALQELGWTEVDCRMLQSDSALFDFKVAIEENLKRKSLTDPEVAIAIKEYDDMKRQIEGSKQRGNPNLLQCNKLDNTNSSKCEELEGWTQKKTAEDLGISEGSVNQAIQIAKAIEEKPELVKHNGQQILQKIRDNKEAQMKAEVITPESPEKKYKTIVIDPPWEVQKIIREVRPNQSAFDYPTMTLDEIKDFPINDFMQDSCHLFLWTIQKYLPFAFNILNNWGLNYIFTMVWHKNGGFQPFNLPQYNCEFILYGRKGSISFLDTKAFSCCFSADRGEHSEKPDVFYELINRICEPPRIEIFARKQREGYDIYGNEV